MCDKRGMFLIDAMLALLLVCVMCSILVIALSMYIKSNHVEQEDHHVEELYEEASRIYYD